MRPAVGSPPRSCLVKGVCVVRETSGVSYVAGVYAQSSVGNPTPKDVGDA